MDGIVDDFGDLYADVEVQANSAINGLPDFSGMYVEPRENEEQITRKVDSTMPTEKMAVSEANGSDSEDDLNIVLNEVDCEVMNPGDSLSKNLGLNSNGYGGERKGTGSNGYGGEKGKGEISNVYGAEGGSGGTYSSQYPQYKYIRGHGAAFSSKIKANGSLGVSSFSSTLARDDWEDNGCKPCKGSSSGQIVHNATANSAVAQSGYCFSLPRYRTILDVNIDTFEEKPWMDPGVDTADFFNFGLNKDTWKDYCKSLEQYRQQPLMQTSIPNCGFSKFNPPQGMAIQVENSIYERQPSLDVRNPHDRDSDVVIQILVHDSTEDSLGFGKEEEGHRDISVNEASEDRDFDMDEKREINIHNIANGDVLSVESVGGITRRSERSAVHRRCSQPMALDSGNNGSGRNSEESHHEEVNVDTLEELAQAMEIVSDRKEEVSGKTWDAAPCMIETTLSPGDQLSLSTSCFGSDSEASKDSVHVAEKNHSSLKQPGTEVQEYVSHDIKNFKSSGMKKKPYYSKDYRRSQSPVREEFKRRSRKLHSVREVNFCSRKADDYLTMLDAKFQYDRDHKRVDCRRWKDRLCDFDYYDGGDYSYNKAIKFSRNHGSERFPENHDETVYTKHSNRKDLQRYRDEMDPYSRENREGMEYIHERRSAKLDYEDMERDWYHCRRGLTTRDTHPVSYRGSRHVVSKRSYTLKERDISWRRKSDKLHFRNRNDHDGWLHDCKHEDDFMSEKYGKSLSFGDREIVFSEEKYETQLPIVKRGTKNFGRRMGYGNRPSLNSDRAWFTEVEDEYLRNTEHLSLFSQPYRESYRADEGRWYDNLSPRNGIHNFKLNERYGNCNEQMISEEGRYRDGCHSYNWDRDTEDSIIFGDDWIHFGGSDLRSKLHWSEDDVIVRHPDDELHGESAYFSDKQTSKHGKICDKYGSSHGGLHVDDMQVEQQGYRRFREGYRASFSNRSSDISYRGIHEQTDSRYRNSVDIVVVEGKSSGRCLKGGGLKCNDRLETKDLKIINKQATAVHTDITKAESNKNNEKWLDKFPITEHKEDMDLEEGQIGTEERTKIDQLEKKCNAENAAPVANVKKRNVPGENSTHRNEAISEYDKKHILETLAKMEKRRERFKEPINLTNELGKNSIPQDEVMVNTAQIKRQRPARKRQWAGN